MPANTWRELISAKLAENAENWSDIVSMSLSDAELDEPFVDQFTGLMGIPFTCSTKRCIYYSMMEHDLPFVGSEPVGAVHMRIEDPSNIKIVLPSDPSSMWIGNQHPR